MVMQGLLFVAAIVGELVQNFVLQQTHHVLGGRDQAGERGPARKRQHQRTQFTDEMIVR